MLRVCGKPGHPGKDCTEKKKPKQQKEKDDTKSKKKDKSKSKSSKSSASVSTKSSEREVALAQATKALKQTQRVIENIQLAENSGESSLDSGSHSTGSSSFQMCTAHCNSPGGAETSPTTPSDTMGVSKTALQMKAVQAFQSTAPSCSVEHIHCWSNYYKSH